MMKKINVVTGLLIMYTCICVVANAQNSLNGNAVLSEKQQSIIRISALTATGDLSKLKPALETGLDAGLTINQIKEVIIHLYAYAGFPRSIRGLQTFMSVLEERKAKGIKDITGADASSIKSDSSRYERGKEILQQLTGIPERGPKTGYAAFAPTIEVFLKEHLFADIFERDVLTYAERELVTISVLSSIGGAEPMLRSHLNICLNVGLSATQLQQFVTVLESAIGRKQATAAEQVMQEVLKSPLFPQGKKVTNNNFTGTVYLQSLVESDSGNLNSVGNVTFEPGARSKWHLHPAGQILLVTDGVGYYQERGQAKRILRKGDVVKCPPNVPHWHGASADSAFVQLAITGREKGETVWLQAVTDEEYKK